MSTFSRPFLLRAFLPALAGVLALAAWYGGISWATDAGIRKFEAHVVSDPTQPAAPQPWRATRFFVDPDSYAWLSDARDLRASGDWRLRFTRADNAPYGREMHWSHLPIWALMGISRFLEIAGGAPPALALELAGRILLPLWGWIVFSALYLVLGHRLGWRIAALATATLVVMVNWSFHTLRPDHHGFQLACSAGMWLSLACGGMGWIQTRPAATRSPFEPPPLKRARRWFIAAGILGGCGLWFGATVFFFSLAASAVGTAAAMFLLRPPAAHEPIEIHPNLWRWWGGAGAVVALAFYALEYAPHHMAMRLEVNHPLYALCWLGTAECLRAIAQGKKNGGRLGRRDLLWAAGGLLGAGALPTLILFGPVDWYWPRSLIMLRLHALHINEFRTLFATAGSRWPAVFLHAFGFFTLAGLGALLLSFRRRLSFAQRTVLLPLGCLSGAFLVLYLWQIRWAPFVLAAALLFTAFLLAAVGELFRAPRPDPILRPFLALLLACFVFHFADAAWSIVGPLRLLWRVEKIDPMWLMALLHRNLMLQLKAQADGRPLRFMMPAELAPGAYYFRTGDAVGSLYWENADGLAAAAEFFADPLPGERAREIARERGITHVLMNEGAGDAVMFYHLATGNLDHPGASRTVGGATGKAGTPVPAWLRPEPELNAAANPTHCVQVPAIGQWVPLPLPLWIYRPEL